MKMKRRKGEPNLSKLILIFSLSTFLWCHDQVDSSKDVRLSFEYEPERLFSTSDMDNQTYRVSPDILDISEFDYKISVVLERMYISIEGPQRENPPGINVTNGVTHQSWMKNVGDLDFNDINSKYILDGEAFVEIVKVGDWSDGDFAELVVTIYYEMDDCSGCLTGTFCCEGGLNCGGEPRLDLSEEEYKMFIFKHLTPRAVTGEPGGHQNKARCLNMSTRCNSHPNCAMICNADESDEICGNLNPNGDFWNMSFLWTALLAIVFFIMAPTVVVFLICYHRQLTVVSRRQGRSDVVTVSSPANDLPPQYDELEETPPPCFCCAVAVAAANSTSPINSTSGGDGENGGLNNPAFVPDDSSMVQHKSIHCSCRPSANISPPPPVAGDRQKDDQIPKISGDNPNNVVSQTRDSAIVVANNFDSNV